MTHVSKRDNLLIELLAVQQIQIAIHPGRNLLECQFVMFQEFPHDEGNHNGVLDVSLPHQRRDEREVFLEIELDFQSARIRFENGGTLADAVFAMIRRDRVPSGRCKSPNRRQSNASCEAIIKNAIEREESRCPRLERLPPSPSAAAKSFRSPACSKSGRYPRCICTTQRSIGSPRREGRDNDEPGR